VYPIIGDALGNKMGEVDGSHNEREISSRLYVMSLGRLNFVRLSNPAGLIATIDQSPLHLHRSYLLLLSPAVFSWSYWQSSHGAALCANHARPRSQAVPPRSPPTWRRASASVERNQSWRRTQFAVTSTGEFVSWCWSRPFRGLPDPSKVSSR